MMSSPVNASEFKDVASHQHMWEAFMRFTTRGVIGTIVVVLFVGWITGVL